MTNNEEEKEELKLRIAQLEEKIFSDIAKEKADFRNAVETVETKEAKMSQIDLALDINCN